LRAASGDSIMVASGTYNENLSIAKNLRVMGSGANTTIVGGVPGRVFSISYPAHVTLSGMKIHYGRGGGIDNSGTLTLSNSTVSGNGAGGVHFGGGVYNGRAMMINNSTISGNSATEFCPFPCFFPSSGGGIFNLLGKLTINNSTISGNSASGGSAIFNDRGTVTISNTTISGNHAAQAVVGYGGTLTMSNTTVAGNDRIGIITTKPSGMKPGIATLKNSIVANNSGDNCFGVTSNGHNLSSDYSCQFNGPGDMINIDPMLGTLGNYGGPTRTIPLLSGSPAIDAGNPAGCTDSLGHLLETDQRGFPRHDPEDIRGCDMGAYELQGD
jgi:hypothetical protein